MVLCHHLRAKDLLAASGIGEGTCISVGLLLLQAADVSVAHALAQVLRASDQDLVS